MVGCRDKVIKMIVAHLCRNVQGFSWLQQFSSLKKKKSHEINVKNVTATKDYNIQLTL